MSHVHGHVDVGETSDHELFAGLVFVHAAHVVPLPYCPNGQPQETRVFHVVVLADPSYPVIYCTVPGYESQLVAICVSLKASLHISVFLVLSLAINPAKVVGGIYPVSDVQP